MSRNVLLVCFAWMVVSACPAFAQSSVTPAFDPRQDAKMHLGSVFFNPTLALTNLGVDTNVFNQPVDPKSDFTATLTPKLGAWLPVAKRALLKTTLDADLVYFATYKSERSVDPTIDTRGEIYLHHVTLFAEDDVLRTRQRPNFEIDARSQRFENGATAGLSVDFKRKVSLDLSAYQSVVRYDQDAVYFGTSLSDALNHTESGLRATLHDQVTSLTGVYLTAESIKDRFDSSAIRNADGYRVVPGVEFGKKALITGSAEVGLRHFAGRDARLPDFSGIVAKTDLSTLIAGATRLGVTWTRDLAYSYDVANPYYVATGIAGSVRRQIAGAVDAIIGANRSVYAYRAFGSELSNAAPARNDVTLTYSADIGYRVNRQARLGFVLSKWQRTSNPGGAQNYNGLRGGLSFTYGF